MSAEQIGLWKPVYDGGYSSTYWVLQRRNTAWTGRLETMMVNGGNKRRWKTEAAAQKVADTANALRAPQAAPELSTASVSDEALIEWADRNAISGLAVHRLRVAYEDAISLVPLAARAAPGLELTDGEAQ